MTKDGVIVLFLDSAILQQIGQIIAEVFHQLSTQIVNKVNHLELNLYKRTRGPWTAMLALIKVDGIAHN